MKTNITIHGEKINLYRWFFLEEYKFNWFVLAFLITIGWNPAGINTQWWVTLCGIPIELFILVMAHKHWLTLIKISEDENRPTLFSEDLY